MINEVKVTDEEILALWELTANAKEKAVNLMIESELFTAKAKYHKMLFWNAVMEKYGINTRSIIWSYDEETQTVSRKEDDDDEHPLAKLLSGLQGLAPKGISIEEDDSGTVI